MDKTLAAQGLRLRCIDRSAAVPAHGQACCADGLWHLHHSDVLVPWQGRYDLDAQDFIVLVSDPGGGRLLGVLTASERCSGKDLYLLLEAAYVAPAAQGLNLLQRMVAVLLLNVARSDGMPSAVVACTRHDAAARNLLGMRHHIAVAAAFPPAERNVVDLAAAGLGRRIARTMRPVSRYAAGTGTFAEFGTESRLVVLMLDPRQETHITAAARRLYERRPTPSEAAAELVQGMASAACRAPAPRDGAVG